MSKEARKLEDHEIVQAGDLVTIYDTVESGFREILTMGLGSPAGVFSYHIYRYVDDE